MDNITNYTNGGLILNPPQKGGILELIGISGVDWTQFLVNLIIAVLLIILGFILGKLVRHILKRVMDKNSEQKSPRYNFLDLIITVVKWSIYILFINLALNQLGIPALTRWLTSVLVVVPAFVAALLLIIVGFAIATYLKRLILETKIDEWESLGHIFFYFILYIFLIFAFKAALISIDKTLVNYLILIWTVILAVGISYIKSKKR